MLKPLEEKIPRWKCFGICYLFPTWNPGSACVTSLWKRFQWLSISIVSHLNQNKYYLCSLSPGLAYFQSSKLPSNIPNIFLHTTNRLLPRYLHGLLSQPLKCFVTIVSLFTLPCQFNFFNSSYPLIAHLIIYLFFHSLSLLTRMCAPWRQELNCWIPYLLCAQVLMQSE